MPVIHIVLVKAKQAVLSNGFEELKQKCEILEDLPIAKSKALRIKWGPPAYPGRNEGYNWGECHTLQMQIEQVLAKLTSNPLLLTLLTHSDNLPNEQVSTQSLPLEKTTRHTVTTKSTESEFHLVSARSRQPQRRVSVSHVC